MHNYRHEGLRLALRNARRIRQPAADLRRRVSVRGLLKRAGVEEKIDNIHTFDAIMVERRVVVEREKKLRMVVANGSEQGEFAREHGFVPDCVCYLEVAGNSVFKRHEIDFSIDATTMFRLHGPKTFSDIEVETVKGICDSDMPKAYKKVLVDFFKGKTFTVLFPDEKVKKSKK